MAEEMTFLPKAELLSLEELDRLCSAFVRAGVRKLRITGGEPLVRRDVMTLFRALSRHLGAGTLDELTLTTNATQLARHAGDLAACGVRRVNVSLDTLDAGDVPGDHPHRRLGEGAGRDRRGGRSRSARQDQRRRPQRRQRRRDPGHRPLVRRAGARDDA